MNSGKYFFSLFFFLRKKNITTFDQNKIDLQIVYILYNLLTMHVSDECYSRIWYLYFYNVFFVCFRDPCTFVMCESFKSLGKTQPFTVSLASNALLLLVSHMMCESFKSLGKIQPFTVSLATNALLLLVSHVMCEWFKSLGKNTTLYCFLDNQCFIITAGKCENKMLMQKFQKNCNTTLTYEKKV